MARNFLIVAAKKKQWASFLKQAIDCCSNVVSMLRQQGWRGDFLIIWLGNTPGNTKIKFRLYSGSVTVFWAVLRPFTKLPLTDGNLKMVVY